MVTNLTAIIFTMGRTDEATFTMEEIQGLIRRIIEDCGEAHVACARRIKTKYLYRGISIGLFLACGMFLLASLIDRAIDKEAAFNESIRLERCAAYNGNIPEDMRGYCD